MIPGREEYVRPVSFAREPTSERRRWIGRILLAVFVVLIGWMFFNRVATPPDDTPHPTQVQTTLPGG